MSVRYVWAKRDIDTRYYLENLGLSGGQAYIGQKNSGTWQMIAMQSQPRLNSSTGYFTYNGSTCGRGELNNTWVDSNDYPWCITFDYASDPDPLSNRDTVGASGGGYWTPLSGCELYFRLRGDIRLWNRYYTNTEWKLEAPAFGNGDVVLTCKSGSNKDYDSREYGTSLEDVPGSTIGYVSSSSSSAYPSYGQSGGYYYVAETNDTIDPESVTLPAYITPGQEVVATVHPASFGNYGTVTYTYWYRINSDIWVQFASTSNTTASFTLPDDANTVEVRVRAADNIGFTSADYVNSNVVSVSEAITITVPYAAYQNVGITVSWTTSSIATGYELQRKSSSDSDFVTVYTGPNTSFTETAGVWTTVQYRVRVIIGSEYGLYVTSDVVEVFETKILEISRSSGNIGAITSDIDFHISSMVVDTCDVSVQVGGFIQHFEAIIGTTYWINVLDFLVGEGTITITASTEVSGKVVKEVSNLVYTKSAQDFPSDNVNVGVLKVSGVKSYPLGLAEGIRVPGGTTLDVVLSDILNKIAELEATPPGPDIRDRTLIQDLADSAGTNTFNQTTGFTPSQSAVLNMLIDYDFQGPDMANLFCIGHNPNEWTTDALRFYIRSGDSVGFQCHFFQQRQNIISVTGVATGHHKLVFKLVCSSPYTVTAWLDGVKIFSENCGSSYAGEWYMSNAEGNTRFKGTYNEISILRSVLTDEELLNASKLNE